MGFRNLQKNLKHCNKNLDVPFQTRKAALAQNIFSNWFNSRKTVQNHFKTFDLRIDDFAQLFEYGTKDKRHSKIKPAPLQKNE